MGHARIIGLKLVSLLLLAGFSHSAAASDDPKKVVDRVLDVSGTTEMFDSFPAMIDQQLAGQMGNIAGPDRAMFIDTMRAAFDPPKLRAAVAAKLIASYDEGSARSTIEWYEGPLGTTIRKADVAAQTPEAQEEMIAFAQAFQTTPPAPAKLEFVQRLDAATRSSELTVEMFRALMSGMMSGMAAMRTEGAPSPSEIDTMIDQQMSQLAPMLQMQTLVGLMFTYRNLSETETTAYLAYAESDPGKWFAKNMGEGFIDGMSRAGNAVATHLAAAMEERMDTISKEEIAKTREAAISDGRAFGKKQKKTDCTRIAIERREACTDLECAGKVGFFLEGCLESGQPEPALCAGAPPAEDLAASIYWRLARCEEYGAATAACNRLMGTLQAYCEEPRVEL
jgi:hypothetical protein